MDRKLSLEPTYGHTDGQTPFNVGRLFIFGIRATRSEHVIVCIVCEGVCGCVDAPDEEEHSRHGRLWCCCPRSVLHQKSKKKYKVGNVVDTLMETDVVSGEIDRGR